MSFGSARGGEEDRETVQRQKAMLQKGFAMESNGVFGEQWKQRRLVGIERS
jgi:hypothetical protein